MLGAPIEVIQADLQNKADVGLSIARHWFDEQKVDAIFGLGNSAVALAVQELCKAARKVDVVIAAGTTDLTGKALLALRRALDLRQLFRREGAGHHAGAARARRSGSSSRPTTRSGIRWRIMPRAILKGLGGRGRRAYALVPLGRPIIPRICSQAASSGADAVGIAAGGADFINIAKQMGEFGLIRRGIVPAALNCSLTNIHSLGLTAAQGMIFSQPYYWDHDEPSRAFARRVREEPSEQTADRVPGEHLGRGDALPQGDRGRGTDEAGAVMEKMRAIPINDFMTKNGRLRIDGTVVRDMFLLRAKHPAQSHSEWDLLEVAQVIPGKDAFRPMNEGGCPLVR